MLPGQSAAGRLCVLAALLLSVSAETMFESRSGMIQELRSALAELAGQGRTQLGRLTGEQTLLSVQKAFSLVLGSVAGGAATVLNLLLQYVSQLLQAAGVQVVLPINRVTPEGLTFVLQWVLVALVGYWLLSLLLRLLASALRRTLWLLKISLALAGFGLILSDPGAGTETMAVRLAVLVCVCVLLGVGSSQGPDVAEKTARLEQQVRILEKRLREMERRRKTDG